MNPPRTRDRTPITVPVVARARTRLAPVYVPPPVEYHPMMLWGDPRKPTWTIKGTPKDQPEQGPVLTCRVHACTEEGARKVFGNIGPLSHYLVATCTKDAHQIPCHPMSIPDNLPPLDDE